MNKRTISFLLIAAIIIYGLFFVIALLSQKEIICVTEQYCITNKDNIGMFVFLQGSLIFTLLLAFRLTLIGLRWVSQRMSIIRFGGAMLSVLGGVGLVLLVAVTPKENLLDYIHIFIIGVFFIILGIVMIVKGKN